jgi:hypothetical protein
MKINKLSHLSKFGCKRKLSVSVRKKIIQYWLSGLKTEQEIRQQYGMGRNLLLHTHRWYNRHFEQPHLSQQKQQVMKSENKSLKAKIKALEKRNKELEKQLEWAELKSFTYEKLIEVTEEDLGIPIRKKAGAKQFKK